ncbi:MAG: iron ABC transporter permease [Planctomycetaceae bacterium]|nr:iron ABC transporter permease [Planctomycetaceae bacterium]
MAYQRVTANRLRGTAPLLLAVCAIITAFVVSNDATDKLLANTLLLATGTILLSLPLGSLLAFLIYGSDLPGRQIFRVVLLALLFMPAYLQVAGWNAGFGQQGWFSRQILLSEAVALLEGWRGAIFLHTVVAIPWVTLIVGAGMRDIPRHLTEQALLDSRPWKTILFVTLPLCLPSLVAATLWIFVTTSCEITITDVYQVRTFAEEIYTGFALGDEIGAAQIRALPGTLLIAGLCLAALIACQTLSTTISPNRISRPWLFPWGRLKWLAVAITMMILLVLVSLPIGNLLYKAGIQVEQSGTERIRQWSLTKCISIFTSSPQNFSEEFGWSTALGQLTAILVLVASLPLAWLARYHRWAAGLGWTFTILGLAIPGPIIALGLGRLFNQPDSDWLFYLYDRTLVLPWCALAFRTFPYAFLIAIFAVQRIPERLLEAAKIDGAGGFAQLRHIVIPQIGTLIASIWIVAFAIAVGDLSTSVLAVPPGVTTVAIRIFNLVHYGVEDQLAGLCLVTMLGFVAIAATCVWLAAAEDTD